ncbi:AI-2E family transporter [Lignipirellula cremea]|uniref:AI-2 transport protein TqsA n=1 Tax=Lignipirellula cremea TaxID=2528010 RepID=A0A518DVQ9_9BACT|nr:AI-2E family transporter [Lignipirellula cremea]QDU95921.1 AI-2 transport protein TqsA [Lignipirellula cremea]
MLLKPPTDSDADSPGLPGEGQDDTFLPAAIAPAAVPASAAGTHDPIEIPPETPTARILAGEKSASRVGGDEKAGDVVKGLAGRGQSDIGLTERLTGIGLQGSCLLILTLLALLAGFYCARAVLFPIVLALLLNFVLSPMIRWLRRRGLPPIFGTALVLLGSIVLVSLLGLALFRPVQNWYAELPAHLRRIEYKLRKLREPFDDIGKVSEKIDNMTKVGNKAEVVQVEIKQPSLTFAALNGAGETIVTGFLALVMLFFLLAAGDRMLEKMVELMPTFRDKRRIVEIARDLQVGMSRYLMTTTLINIGLGACIGLGLWAIGIPNALLWGVMATLLNYVPFLGACAGAVVVFLVGVLSFDSLSYAALAPAIYLGVNVIEANFVTPTLLGRSISLNPAILIITFTFFAWMWGIGGAIIAVPALAVIKIGLDHHETTEPFGRFLGE